MSPPNEDPEAQRERVQLTYVDTQPDRSPLPADLRRTDARLPIEFRTLSIHVETRRSLDSTGNPKDPLKIAARGMTAIYTHQHMQLTGTHRVDIVRMAQDFRGGCSPTARCLSSHWVGNVSGSAASSLERSQHDFQAEE